MSELRVLPGPMEELRLFEEKAGLLKWVASVDHKQIGVMYMVSSLGFFLVGGVEALLMRLQLALPENRLLSPEAYDQLFTLHGTTMIFLVTVPMLVGLGKLPCSAHDRGARHGLSATERPGLLVVPLRWFSSLLQHSGRKCARHGLVQLCSAQREAILFLAGRRLLGARAILDRHWYTLAGINLIVTIATLRAPGMTLKRLPLFAWMTAVNSFLIVFALPALNAAVVMLLIDRNYSAVLHRRCRRVAILWQHFFWSFGHPEVYIMVLPAFGIISEVIPVFSRKPIFGYGFVAGVHRGHWAVELRRLGAPHVCRRPRTSPSTSSLLPEAPSSPYPPVSRFSIGSRPCGVGPSALPPP